ncbi:MAG: hypothetical protein ACRBF0_25450 [Calditrichia bacterium]
MNYLKAALVVLLLSSMTLAAWHVYECADEHDCTICIVQKSATGFLMTSSDTAPACQYPTIEIDEPVSIITEDVFASASASRAPPTILH